MLEGKKTYLELKEAKELKFNKDSILVLKVPKDLSDRELCILKKRFQEEFSGTKNAHKVLVIPNDYDIAKVPKRQIKELIRGLETLL